MLCGSVVQKLSTGMFLRVTWNRVSRRRMPFWARNSPPVLLGPSEMQETSAAREAAAREPERSALRVRRGRGAEGRGIMKGKFGFEPLVRVLHFPNPSF